VRTIAVLDRTKEPGSLGEPLYQDVVTALSESRLADRTASQILPRVIGGRYGLSSKEFTPAMAKAIFDELKKSVPKNHFTVGIHDDVTHTSLDCDPEFFTEDPNTVRALFYGLGSDGTVGETRIRSRLSERIRTTMPRGTLSMTRRRRGRSRFHTSASVLVRSGRPI
jgi:pyruvate-ferredoxin/flavodoxin oxidoreductase